MDPDLGEPNQFDPDPKTGSVFAFKVQIWTFL
jgi:hypothetical protein